MSGTPALTHIMGVVNVTDDSFSDGGRFVRQSDAVAHGVALAEAGADIIDVGGQSTRPGAAPVNQQVELDRVIPVIKDLAGHGLTVSVDTMRSDVAAAALAAGARMVNDVSGGRFDPAMAPLMAESGFPWVLMHWRSNDFIHTATAAGYADVVADVSREMMQSVDLAVQAGASTEQLILDPGLGFAKNAQHNWQLLQAIPDLQQLGFPILIGASRKRFLGSLLSDLLGVERPPDGRETATAVITALAALHEVWGVRVHDVRSSMDALKVVRAWETAGEDAADLEAGELLEPATPVPTGDDGETEGEMLVADERVTETIVRRTPPAKAGGWRERARAASARNAAEQPGRTDERT